jgi:photosystem II Psb27 protein
MQIKSYLSKLLALVLVVVIGLVGCASPTGLTGNYTQDTLAVVENLTTAIELPDDAANKQEAQSLAKKQINDYISRYRRDGNSGGLQSFTTMQTALNSLAGYYTSYGNRPLPEKLKKRLLQEFSQVKVALKRGI